MRVEKVFCGRMDHGGCGLLVHIADGKIHKIQGDPESRTRGYVCQKGLAHMERLYHPERLTQPLKRIGHRGEGRWEKISWDEALDTVTGKLKEVKNTWGPEKALFMQGTPKGIENLLLYRFARSFGSPNVAATGTVCYAPRLGASLVTTGFYPHPDLDHPPELLLLWGANHLSTNADCVLSPEITGALERGSALMAVDPVKRPLASKSRLWLQIRPGTDLLLAMGLIRIIIQDEIYDREFVDHWTEGFEQLKAHAFAMDLEDIAGITYVTTEQMKAAARLYVEASSAAILWGNALDHTINSVQTARALLILMALSGNLDRPGGNIHAAMPELVRMTDFMLIPKYRSMQNTMIGKEFPLTAMLGFVPMHSAIRAMAQADPYPVKSVYIQGTNPLMAYPGSRETFEALQNVDFLAVAELFMTPTAHLADIVLPVASHFEFDDLGCLGFQIGRILARPKLVEPPGACRSDIWIINEMARRLGLGETFWDDEEGCIDHILAPAGIGFQELKKQGFLAGQQKYEKYREKGFRTKSGKVELYSSWMEKNSLPPLPVYQDMGQGMGQEVQTQARGDLPLVFTSAKLPNFFHSMNRNLAHLRRTHPEPILQLHPDTAKSAGVQDNAWVWVENEQGRARFRASLSTRVSPGTVLGEHAWWFPEEGPSRAYRWEVSNINFLTSNGPPYEPAIGTVNLRGFPCRVYAAE
jgi:anaerobic selenocysteine-containing dehydrogenase